MKVLFTFSILFIVNNIFSQLSPERVARIKSATVRVSIDSSNNSGTAFFISSRGELLTCWHVIEPAIKRDSLNRIIGFKKIFINIDGGEKVQVDIPIYFFQQGYNNAVANDFCLLFPLDTIKTKAQFLKLGNFDNAKEGDFIYTSGYALGMPQQFLSTGIISTIYIDSTASSIDQSKGTKTTIKRDAALLDITMNRGNSGGAIIKVGNTMKDDEVIGIASFIINPFGGAAEYIYNNVTQSGIDIKGGKFSMQESLQVVSKAVANASNGMSGCISINHFLKEIESFKRINGLK